jgi:hypothetical protein
MDEAVRRAMRKWPDVPAAFGWLGLDARGHWLIRGDRIGNRLVSQFIDRNYACDEHGRWFFQNGPQRVFVALAYTPWILRIGSDLDLSTHTGLSVERVASAWMDREGVLLLGTEHGVGIVDDRDLERLEACFADAGGRVLDEDALIDALDSLQSGRNSDVRLAWRNDHVRIEPIEAPEVPRRFGYVRDPEPLPQERTRD